jgi:glycosyltransferase involved in cell wall biosynthesis
MAATLGLVIPAYQPDVEQLSEYVDGLLAECSPAEIRIELDSPDEAVRSALADLPVTVSSVPYRRGKGAAITAGFEALETDILGFVDADGATPATEFRHVVAAVQDGESDLAVASRRHPQARVATHQTFARRFLGDSFAWLGRRLLPVDLYDYQCGAKVLTAETWAAIRDHLYEPGFAWDIELISMTSAVGRRVEEVPVEWYDKPGSTVSPVRDSARLARTLVVVRHRAKQLRDSRLHSVIADRRDTPEALIERNRQR